MIALAPQYTQRIYRWADWKAERTKRAGVYQHDETDGVVTVYFYDGPEVFLTQMWTSGMPVVPGYSAEQNAADLAEWLASWAAGSNATIVPKSRDGRTAVRMSTANRMTCFKLRCISFYTSELLEGLHNVSPLTGTSYGDVTMRLYAADGSEITTEEAEANAVKTVLDFEPPYDYEIIGGNLNIPHDLRGGDTDAWYISAIGVPDYPPEYYGSIDFISEVNIEAVTTEKIVSDGRAVQFMPYQYGGAPGTNKLRFIIRHPAGARKRFQLYLEHFTP